MGRRTSRFSGPRLAVLAPRPLTVTVIRTDKYTVYEIDGRRFSTLEGFYDEASRLVTPGADWGHNLDALNDNLRGDRAATNLRLKGAEC